MADAVAREVEAIHREDDLRELVGDGRKRAELALPRLLRRHQIRDLEIHALLAALADEVDLLLLHSPDRHRIPAPPHLLVDDDLQQLVHVAPDVARHVRVAQPAVRHVVFLVHGEDTLADEILALDSRDQERLLARAQVVQHRRGRRLAFLVLQEIDDALRGEDMPMMTLMTSFPIKERISPMIFCLEIITSPFDEGEVYQEL